MRKKHKLKPLLLLAAIAYIFHVQAQPSSRKLDSLHQLRKQASGIQQTVDALNALGIAWRGVNSDSVLFYGHSAFQYAGNKYPAGKAVALNNISSGSRTSADYTTAMEAGLQATHIFDSLGMKSEKADVLMDLAQLYKDISGSNNTEAYLDQAIEYAKQSYGLAASIKDTASMADALNMQGICLRDKSKQYKKRFYYDSAIICYEKALALIERSGKGINLQSKLYNNMSQVYNEYKLDYPKALEYLFKAVDANKKRNNIAGLSFNYGNIAYAYTMLGNHNESLHYAKLMLDACRQINRPERLRNAYGQMYRSFQGLGRLDSALAYYILEDNLNDSLTNLGKTREVLDLQAKYETNKKELEIQQLQVESQARNRNIIWLLAGIGVLAGIMIWLIILYRNMAKQKKEISEQRLRLEVMMKELHHRVKNNLQIVSSLLSLQSNRLEDENAIAALKESQLRVQAMSFIHQRLYKTDNITSVNMKEYITDLAESLVASYGFDRDGFDLQMEVQQEFLDIDKALPAGLIINELVTNSLKYAYGKVDRPVLHISLLNNTANDLIISVSDNGPGIDPEVWKKQRSSFGKQLITALCKQLRASQQPDDIPVPC
ncbi:MAG: hypothetical protein J7578_24930, partial [Chitinophagaceae bacterium]|nr:hypothetical protein [Chitinophagaceae bacterium]